MAKAADADQNYEDEKKQIALALFRQALAFTEIDNKINADISRIIAAAAAYVETNPDAFDGRGDVSDLVKSLKAAGPGMSGGDIAGGGVIDDIIDLIKGAGDLIKSEKEFFFNIIKLIFCGCKSV